MLYAEEMMWSQHRQKTKKGKKQSDKVMRKKEKKKTRKNEERKAPSGFISASVV